MSWQNIMQRVLPPAGGVLPHITSPYGEVGGRPLGSSIPHRAVDFNYIGGRYARLNLSHPALRAPVSGTITKAGRDKFGTIAIRDANGLSHEILHTDRQHVTVGDPVVAGQLIGTMGNAGTNDQHVHYQLKDPAGNILNPTAFWDQQGPVDPNPTPPALLQEYQQYLQRLGVNAGNRFGNLPNVASAPAAPLVPPNEVHPPDRSESFNNRYGDWGSVPARSFGDADSAFLPALEKHRTAVSGGPASVAALPAPSSVDNSPAYAFDPSKPPPPFTPSNYALAYGNIDKWIASLAGVEPDDPMQFQVPPIFSPLYRR